MAKDPAPTPLEGPNALTVYRFASSADIASIVALVNPAYRGTTGWTSEADLLGGQRTDAASVRELLDERGAAVLLGFAGDDLISCCELREPAVPGGAAYFGMLAVRPGSQGGGIGARMLAEAERVCREQHGAAALELTVISRRVDLIAWYLRRGFVPTGTTSPFPYGDERFGIPKVDDLEFIVLRKQLVTTLCAPSHGEHLA